MRPAWIVACLCIVFSVQVLPFFGFRWVEDESWYSSTAYRLWKEVHGWLGLVVTIPLFCIGLTGAMMLDQLGHAKAAEAVERSVVAVIGRMKSMAAGKMGFSTSQVGDMVAEGL